MRGAYFETVGRTMRAFLAVVVFGVLMMSLMTVHNKHSEEERRASYVMSVLSWTVSEALLEGNKLVTAFVKYPERGGTREDIIFASELFWSRVNVLLESEFNHYPGLKEAGSSLQTFLSDNEYAIYEAPALLPNKSELLEAELASLLKALRATWIRDYLGQRDFVYRQSSEDIRDARVLFEGLIIGCVVLLGLYMVAEIFCAHRAQVRERSLRNQALSANKAKSLFVANVSHEIRTPLNGVVGMAQELNETVQTSEQQQMTEVILSSAEVLLATINDVLDLSKMESGRLRLEAISFDPAERVKAVIALHMPIAHRKNVVLDYVLHQPEGALVVGDPLRFIQVINNLVSNAIKFTDEGKVSVLLGIGAPDEGKGIEVEVCVTDTGIGLSEDAAAAIFEPFTQADASTTRENGGTGLGLTIARAICREMGGDISLTSTQGQGSTFIAKFRLFAPHELQNDSAAPCVHPAMPTQPCALMLHKSGEFLKPCDAASTLDAVHDGKTGPRILLVDDSPTNRLVMKQLLKSLNPSIDEAERGLDAVRLAAENAYDLILMDIQMPGMDGVEATARIRAKEDATGHARPIPIIAVTANVMAHQVESYLQKGVDRVIAKPVRKSEILDAISDVHKTKAA